MQAADRKFTKTDQNQLIRFDKSKKHTTLYQVYKTVKPNKLMLPLIQLSDYTKKIAFLTVKIAIKRYPHKVVSKAKFQLKLSGPFTNKN